MNTESSGRTPTPSITTPLPESERFVVEFRALGSDPLRRPGHQRLRALLKLALRGLYLKAESVRPADGGEQ